MTNTTNVTTTTPTDYHKDLKTYTYITPNDPIRNGSTYNVNAVQHPVHSLSSSSMKPSPEFVEGKFAIYEVEVDYNVSCSFFVASSMSGSEDRIKDIKLKLAIRLAEGMIENNLIHFFYRDEPQKDMRKFMGRVIVMDKDSIKKAKPR